MYGPSPDHFCLIMDNCFHLIGLCIANCFLHMFLLLFAYADICHRSNSDETTFTSSLYCVELIIYANKDTVKISIIPTKLL